MKGDTMKVKQIADTLDISVSSVYKFLDGSRVPKIPTMKKIEVKYDWSTLEQVKARLEGTYATEFRTKADK